MQWRTTVVKNKSIIFADMKIMYCIRGLHNSGGMERVLSVKANLLASRGHEVSIVVLRLKGRKPFFPIDPSVNIVDLSAPYLSLPGHPSSANATSDSPRTTVSSAAGSASNPASCSAIRESSASPVSSAVGSASSPSTGSARTESSASNPASCSARMEGVASVPATGASERLKGSVRKRLSRVVEMLDPDVCVSLCGPEVRILPAVAGGRPCVAEYHFSHDKFYRKYGGIFLYPYAWLRTHMLERAVSEYGCMVTLTEHDLPIWKRHCRRVERIFNPVTTPPGQVSRLAEKRMIAVGRLEDQKNFKDLVSAWSIVAERCPDWRLEIFGEGKLEHALRSQIARLGLTGSVILRGVVKDIASEYSNSSALLMTSLHEGFPLALVEASSFGLPLISYDCPTGPSEIIIDAGDGGFDGRGAGDGAGAGAGAGARAGAGAGAGTSVGADSGAGADAGADAGDCDGADAGAGVGTDAGADAGDCDGAGAGTSVGVGAGADAGDCDGAGADTNDGADAGADHCFNSYGGDGAGNVPAATLDQAAGNTPNGYLVPVGDVRTLADRICRIASDDNLRLRLGAASKASSHRFTPETIISAWEHLFSSLL